MPLYEIRFDHVETHPYFIKADNEEDAKKKGVGERNHGTRSKKTIDDIVFCEVSHKVPLESVAIPYTRHPNRNCHVDICYLKSHIATIRMASVWNCN